MLVLRYVLFRLFKLFSLNRSKVVLSNFHGNGYGDNPKYIADEIIRQNLDYDLVWLARREIMKSRIFPNKIRLVRVNSIRAIYEMATAKVWVGNVRQPRDILKRKGQYYIQTSHGGLALKRVEKDVEEQLDPLYVKDAKTDSQKVDVFLSNSSWFTCLVRSSFWYEGEIMESGFPRTDVLLSNSREVTQRVREYFGIPKHIKIVLYAPTFRRDHVLGAYNLDVSLCLEALSRRFSGEWILITRLHPNIDYKSDSLSYGANCLNGTNYDDVQELLCAADVVITDYSGIMFDFAIRRLPVLLYTPDVNRYKADRQFYFSFEELPFPVSQNNQGLVSNIIHFDTDAYVEKVNLFLTGACVFERGDAARKVVDRIRSYISPREI